MTTNNQSLPKPRAWGEFRFSVVGGLLAAPPNKGELKTHLEYLSAKTWQHPLTGKLVQFSFATIEEWYYIARKYRNDPVSALSTRHRSDRGHGRALSSAYCDELLKQYKRFPDWTVKLHADNLLTLIAQNPELGAPPSYATTLRYMKENGLKRQKKIRRTRTPALEITESNLEKKEIRSYEVDHVGSLWHLDFHHTARKIQGKAGEWRDIFCLAIHDDHSRVACHVQWYSAETAKNLIHGVSQAIMKRGRPWTIMTDNGAAMKAAEFTEGLSRIGIMHTTTLPYAAYQNGKTERFWGILEGRLMAMLKDTELTMTLLNETTIAWVEGEYNRTYNREISATPYERFTASADVSRPPLSWEEMRLGFRMEVVRKQRRSDGTVTIDGSRFEVPTLYRNLDTLRLQYARWDLSMVHIVDNEGKSLVRLLPLDRSKNAEGYRRPRDAENSTVVPEQKETTLPPLLEKLVIDFAATGLPSPYLPEIEEACDEN